MGNKIRNIALWSIVSVTVFAASLSLHGLITYQLTPVETMQCAAEEIESSFTNGTDFLTTQCEAIRSTP